MSLELNLELRDLAPSFLTDITPRPSTSTSRLRAIKISAHDYPEGKRIASLWETTARDKERQAQTWNDKTQFQACANISRAIASCFGYPSYNNRRIYSCTDSEGNHQGMMVLNVERERVYVAYLVTNPINIRSSVNANEPKRGLGAGTCLLKKAEEIAIEEGKESVWLTPLDSAVGFYTRNGFTFEGWSMKKTVQKIYDDIALPYFDVA